MEDSKLSEYVLSINDILRDIEKDNINSLILFEKTNSIRELIDKLNNKK